MTSIQLKSNIPTFFLISLILINVILVTTLLQTNTAIVGADQQSSRDAFVGVNMVGYYTTMAQSRGQPPIPSDYYEKSFSTLSQAGIGNVRYLFAWESYEKNPTQFINELNIVANTADKWSIRIIYDNDQHYISSWLEPRSGYGFAWQLFSHNSVEFPSGSGGTSDTLTAQRWWTDWYNRSIKDAEGNDGWTLQANFMKQIVNAVDNHKSTLGYEILNEPQVYSIDQWDKIGKYNTFIANELRTITKKIIVFDRQLPSDVGGPLNAFPENMAKMAPKNVTNVLFKSTLYGLPTHCSSAEGRLNTAAETAKLLGIPLWIGEFNIGTTAQHPIADLNQTEVNTFVQKFKEIKAWGWSLWIWSFIPSSVDTKNANLVNFTTSYPYPLIGDGTRPTERLQTTKYFDYLKNAVSNTSNTDTICPTLSLTKVGGMDMGTLYPSSVPVLRPPIPISISVEGEAYDVGSGIKVVQIHLDGHEYRPAIPKSQGDWLHWYASLPLTNTTIGAHKLVAKATDNAGNIGYDTITIDIV
jgi:hypothetical protein